MRSHLVWAVLLCTLAAAQTPPADLRGIYVFTNDVSQISATTAKNITSALGIPGMDGIMVVIGWDAIEPAMGQYQWATLDQWISQGISSGKKIGLSINAGSSTPAWLFQAAPTGAGAKALKFTISPHGGATGLCQSLTMAAPWDSAFLARWDSILAAVAAHLQSAGTYKAITHVRLTGINRTTEETRLPAETAQSTGLACVSDAIGIWQQAGYKPSLLLSAWDKITASFLKSFPDKSFSVSIIPTNPFPPIAEDGTVLKAPLPDENLPLLTLGSQKFPGHLVVMFDFLMPGEAASPDVVSAAQSLGTLAAFQTNEYFGQTGGGAACSEPVTNPTPCTAATFLQLLDTGIYPLGQSNPLRAQFIEVFHANATAFPDDITQGHYQLIPPVISTGGVVHAATYQQALAPGLLASVFGSSFALAAASASGLPLPQSLGLISATVNGKAAPFVYAGGNQVNVQIPYETVPGSATVQVTADGVASPAVTVQVSAVAPGLFVYGSNHAAAQNQDYSTNSTTNGAAAGSVVILYATGQGALDNPIATGAAAPASPFSKPLASVTATIGGQPAPVQFAGMAPGFVGLFQLNVQVPQLKAGDYPVVITVGGQQSNAPLITVK